jgi:RNA polymerase sigma-70 factor (ECF subfamily)
MMLKITPRHDSGSLASFLVEGRLTRESAAELQAACTAALDRRAPLVLHLGGVTFADAAGVEALQELRRSGCVVVGCSDFVGALLDEPATRGASEGSTEREEVLLQALRQGDARAFEHLVRRQSGSMLAAARRILGSEEDARDAVQEAFVSAYRHLATFDGDAKLSTWLHRIAINASLMKLRSRRRRPEEPIDDLLACFDENGAWASGGASLACAAEAHVASRETRELVRGCIARLPETYREVLVLRDIEDLDTAEVSDALGITRNAVKIRLHRARQALRALIEAESARRGDEPTVAASRAPRQTAAA